MRILRFAVDEELLRSIDHEVRRDGLNLSSFIRAALRDHLRQRRVAQLEAQERRGYEKWPVLPGELAEWDRVAQWPEE